MSSIKTLVKDWVPPIAIRLLQSFRRKGVIFEGDYVTWEEASAQCSGYDAKNILDKVLDATLKVKRGEAVYERDSVLFDKIEYVWPVLTALMWIAAQSKGKLDVLDFGGALGSSYFQNRTFLADLKQVRWSVVEQSHYVDAGKTHIADERLQFYKTIEHAVSAGSPNIVLLSSVLQYLPNPLIILKQLTSLNADCLIIDRTPFIKDKDLSVIKIQHVPSSIYEASYPCWFFNMDKFLEYIESLGYRKIEIFQSLDRLSNEAIWQGIIFKKKNEL
uniref:Methyltransferase, TIGR04325 family n=1 Tax=Chlorobium chlorochromatii (strain CaD3) TaxID=340177 RepID=Q3AST2_CHLCH